uniref:Uncharacterized protein n=1 Tax=Meloidogyne javanica TaxID=6303 RepID=A0A915LWD0_MELJA
MGVLRLSKYGLTAADQVKELFNLTPRELLKIIKALGDNRKGESSKSNFEEIGKELNEKIKEELDKEIIEDFEEEGDFEKEEKLKEENTRKAAGKEEVNAMKKGKGKVSESQEGVLNEGNNERNLFINEESNNYMRMKEEGVEKEVNQGINEEAKGRGKILEEVDDIEEEIVKNFEEDFDKSKEGLNQEGEININSGKGKIIEEINEKKNEGKNKEKDDSSQLGIDEASSDSSTISSTNEQNLDLINTNVLLNVIKCYRRNKMKLKKEF